MKKIFCITVLGIALLAFDQSKPVLAQAAYYGDKITAKKAMDVSELKEAMGDQEELTTKVKATLIESCPKKGCWMQLDMGNGETMRVSFKDYGFFVPKDGSTDGKEVIIEGVARKETTSVAELRHYAEDAGKTAKEIAAITEPKEEYTFEAVGVIIKD